MAHTPHVHVARPWGDGEVTLPGSVRHHLEKVLRRTGGELTYTDGAGTVGRGRLDDGRIVRGAEWRAEGPRVTLTMVVAPPHRTARVRMVVEKLAELGVSRLEWLRTSRTVGRVPARDKAVAWATGALEQSQGARLMEVGGTPHRPHDVSGGEVMYAHPGGEPVDAAWSGRGDAGPVELTVAVGPEGGFTPEEIPERAPRLGLGERVLRTETAAVVAAALVLDAARRRG